MKTKVEIVKIGGQLIDDESLLLETLGSLAKSRFPKILVHGGGKMATRLSQKLGMAPKMVDGRRVTEDEDLQVVTMVYAGLINKSIVAKLQSIKVDAIGLSGCDMDCIRAKKRNNAAMDFGFVGDVKQINLEKIDFLLKNKLLPVFSAITHDGNGQLLNTNADSIAAQLAIALSEIYEIRLIYCFEKNGVLIYEEDENSVIPELDSATYAKLKLNGQINQGMIVKLDNCFDALQKGVANIMIGKPQIINNTSQIHTKLIL